MALEVYLYNNLIPLSDIRKLPRSDEKISINGTTLIASKLDVILDNTDPAVYDDRYVGSLFYGTDWYNQDAIIYDDGQIIWKGRIKSLNVDEKSGQLTVSTANTIRDMANTACVINSTSNVTPAEIIYNILTDADYLALTDDDINYSGFNEAIAIQDAATVYARCVFTLKDNKYVASVVSELCRITQSHLYTIDNKICMYQWREWDGQLGTAVNASNVLPLSYSHSYDDSKLSNYYSIYYDSSGTATQTTGVDTSSVSKFGTRVFAVPDDPPTSTTSTDYRILLLTKAAADWCGDLAISRYSNIKKICKVTVDDSLKDLVLGFQADLNFTPFQREPVQVIERSYDRENRTIAITGEFLNAPYEYYDRDTEPPITPEIVNIYSIYSKIYIKWTVNYETDFAGYKLYFTTSPGEWESETSAQGISPIDIKNPSTTPDGYNIYAISGLSINTPFHFKIKSYDTRFNVSASSNIMQGMITSPLIAENFYCCIGNIYSGITTDNSNSLNGIVPEGYTTYEDFDDPECDYSKIITAAYQSSNMYNHQGFQRISFISTCDLGNIKFNYKNSTDGVTWSEWTSEENINNTTHVISGTYIIYNILFYNPNWTNTDSVRLKTIL